MKKCKNCGALQSDKHFFCIDCNKKLDAPLSDEDKAKEEAHIEKTIQNLSNKSDYFYVSKSDKTTTLLLGILSVLHIILMIIRKDFYREYYLQWIVFIIIVLSISVSIDVRFPRISWNLYKLRFYLAIDNIDDIEPSNFMLWARRFVPRVILLLVIMAFIVMLIASFTYVPGSSNNINNENIIYNIKSGSFQH